MQDLWVECKGINYLTKIHDSAWRIIEAQNITATRKLVDSLGEQTLLEEMIESTKPFLSKENLKMHPLLYTPFRYPPLKYGSRFGNRFEHALWYGSLKLETAMAEKAYYQFNFLRASKADFGPVEILFTAFSAKIKTSRGIKLTEKPFDKHAKMISSPISYEVSQRIGNVMRQENIEAFYYYSARDLQLGTNVGVFTPKAFAYHTPQDDSFQTWQCLATHNVIEFVRSSVLMVETKHFPLEKFLVDGKLPFPAN